MYGPDDEDEAVAKDTVPPLKNGIIRKPRAANSRNSKLRDPLLILGEEGEEQVEAVTSQRGIGISAGPTPRTTAAHNSRRDKPATLNSSSRAQPNGAADEPTDEEASTSGKPAKPTEIDTPKLDTQRVTTTLVPKDGGVESPAPSLKRKRATADSAHHSPASSVQVAPDPPKHGSVLSEAPNINVLAPLDVGADTSGLDSADLLDRTAQSSGSADSARLTGSERFKPTPKQKCLLITTERGVC